MDTENLYGGLNPYNSSHADGNKDTCPLAALIIFHLAMWRISRCKKPSILEISRVLQISYVASKILL
jgi:hypothetical protein